MNSESIVITGAGLVSALGLDVQSTWSKVREGRCGIAPLKAIEQKPQPDKGGGEAPPLPEQFHPEQPREVRHLLWTLDQAQADARLKDANPYPAPRRGLVLGTTLHGMRAGGRFLRSDDPNDLGTFLAGAAAQPVAAEFDAAGFSATTCSACSSALGAISLGVTLLQSGQLDLVVAGGYDAMSEYVYAGFNSLRLVAGRPQMPFARDREGMKVAEGFGLVVLERQSDAKRRGARIIARVLGCGESSDVHHLTQPHPEGEGAARAIAAALEDARLTPGDIDMISAHATATPDNDAAEYLAFAKVFGDQLAKTPVAAFKSHLGHTLGGAGAVELILSTAAMTDQVIPPAANVCAEQIEFADLQLVTGQARPHRIRTTLNTSMGFGGSNTCIILGSENSAPAAAVVRTPPKAPAPAEVFITGVGVVMPGAIGNDAYIETMRHPPELHAANEREFQVDDESLSTLVSPRRMRRISGYAKLHLAAASAAYADAGIADHAAFGQRAAAILASTHGAANYCHRYYRQIVDEGIDAANPLLFAEGVPNCGSAHASLMFGIRGPSQTIIGTRTAGLDALRLAAAQIAAGRYDRVLIGAAEEYEPQVERAYANRHRGKHSFQTCSGAVSLILESRSSLEARGIKPRGRVTGCASVTALPPIATSVPGRARSLLEQLCQPTQIIGSTIGSRWDCFERTAIRSRAQRETSGVTWSSMFGHHGELFSVTPLAGLAAALLTGRLPRLLTELPAHGLTAASGAEPADDFAVIASDWHGSVSGVRLARMGR